MDELLARYFDEPPDEGAAVLLQETLARGIVAAGDLARVFEHLRRCRALPRRPGLRFVRHFTMWLEIINHARFIPIITAPGRLDALAALLGARLRAAAAPERMTLADVGTGQPPYTTVELAACFPSATIHGFDLYLADAIVRRPDGAYAVFDGGGQLRGVQAAVPELLHAMILDWEGTRTAFEERRAALAAAPDGDGWTLVRAPVRALLRDAGEPDVRFHAVPVGDFRLAALADESVDVVWSFNCLLHYPARERHGALGAMARRLRIGGLVMEGYTSPSGRHAIYQLWRRERAALVPIELGWSPSNLRRPLWPLAGPDPQVALLADLVGQAKEDPDVAAAAAAPSDAALDDAVLRSLVACLERAGRPTTVVARRFVVHDVSRCPEVFSLAGGIPLG